MTQAPFRRLAVCYQLSPHGGLALQPDRPVLAFLASGATKLVAATLAGREQVVGFQFAGDVLTIAPCDHYRYSLCPLRETDLLLFDYGAFVAAARDKPDVLEHLLERSAAWLEHSREKSIALGQNTAAERVAGFLLSMTQRIGHASEGGASEGGILLDLPMTRGDIAASLGLTIETISRQFTLLRDAGIIATSGRSCVLISRPSALVERAGFAAEPA